MSTTQDPESSIPDDPLARLRAFCLHIQAELGFEMVGIGRIVNDDCDVRMLVILDGETFQPTVTYGLAGTPCKESFIASICIINRDVQTLYPDDTMLADLGIEAYAGFPLISKDGVRIGIVWAMSRTPKPAASEEAALFMTRINPRIRAEVEGIE